MSIEEKIALWQSELARIATSDEGRTRKHLRVERIVREVVASYDELIQSQGGEQQQSVAILLGTVASFGERYLVDTTPLQVVMLLYGVEM